MTTFSPIGYIESPFNTKFGVPRQPGLVPHSAWLVLEPEFRDPLAFRDLEGFSHLWVLFHFHAVPARERWSPLVRPPRLGGNNRVGVFASRSPYRPNPIGLSLVGNGGLKEHKGELALLLLDGDFVDGTPVFDIKPYLPYAEMLPEARGGYAHDTPPPELKIEYLNGTDRYAAQIEAKIPGFLKTLETALSLDPRPRYKPDADDHIYGLPLHNYNVRWSVRDGVAQIVQIETLEAYMERTGDKPHDNPDEENQ